MRFRTRLVTPAFLAFMAFSTPALCSSFETIFTFPQSNSAKGTNPAYSIVFQNGKLYGVATSGGSPSDEYNGTIYELNVRNDVEKTIYSFQDAADGHIPNTGLVDVDGIFYGATGYGIVGCGAVYALSPKTKAFSVIYTFPKCFTGSSSIPVGLFAANGVLYGTAQSGGSNNHGTLFEVDPLKNSESDLYSFAGGSDGDAPEGAPLYLDSKLYGTTSSGGNAGLGTLFSFDLKTKIKTTLFSFPGGDAGSYAGGDLLYANGSIYGVTSGKTANPPISGSVYRYEISTGVETTIHSFVGERTGLSPQAGLTLRGNLLYGTTVAGGLYGNGTIFTINIVTGHHKVIYDFSNTDGQKSLTPLVFHKGVFYGTTDIGGSSNQGTIFSFTP